MKFYTYKIQHKNTKQFYIGSRLCRKEKYFKFEHLDFGIEYKSSSKLVKEIGFDDFELVYFNDNFDDYHSCYIFEQDMIKENIQNPLCLNQSHRNPDDNKQKFYSYGREVSQETRDKISRSNTGKKHINRKRVSHSEETKHKQSLAKLGKPNLHTQNMNKTKIECEHCHRFFNLGNYKCHHGERCKLRIPKLE